MCTVGIDENIVPPAQMLRHNSTKTAAIEEVRAQQKLRRPAEIKKKAQIRGTHTSSEPRPLKRRRRNWRQTNCEEEAESAQEG